jgi:hypothetical protein
MILRIKYFIFLLTIFPSLLNAQDNIIIKKITSRGINEVTVKEIGYKDKTRIWEKNISSNGWQVLDSIAYNPEKSESPNYYEPVYSENSKSIEKYILEEDYFNSTELNKTNPIGDIVKDKFSLSSYYISVIDDILRTSNIDSASLNLTDTIIANYIPSILTHYGIPWNQLLDSCYYHINNEGFIEADKFYFNNYILEREYQYEDSILRQVNISVEMKRSGKIKTFTEKFLIN